ncbi:TetR/AcrR family transcriptional regulator [Pseudomonas viridiflava]|uniref:TetR/AcrR family transcriptional regulator n=1 Tax=Pseudomonas viridiflava TaxID=33069 RepID=UPI001FD66C17|nr:TetR/AcrR family transcriptional regulator [Pseudomonas viridiflava]MCJ8176635.1 TetR/AcrR family transcriptional regulator [Pseudomonas viridiflava]
MRPLKISREEMLLRCANVFKRLGYHGTTMDALSSACGLTKASFYHHYSSKEALLHDVLVWTHTCLSQSLFAVADDTTKSPHERLAIMGRRASKLFLNDSIGCLMGVISIDAAYGAPELMGPVRNFMDDWAAAFAKLYSASLNGSDSLRLARQLVGDYEGAILMARIYADPVFIDAVTLRALTHFVSDHPAG